jgi:8-oxo-dGTP diphosphatase
MKDRRFFVGQKAFIERDRKVLVLYSKRGFLDMPGGRIADGEWDLAEALKREVREETSLEIEVGQPFITWFFEPPETSPFLVGYKCRWLSGEVQLSEEHESYLWVSRNTLSEIDNGSTTFGALQKYFQA